MPPEVGPAAARAGVPFVPEGYVDLDYDSAGKLVLERVKQLRDPRGDGRAGVRLVRDGDGRRRSTAASSSFERREHLRPRRRAERARRSPPRSATRSQRAGVELAPLAELRRAAPRAAVRIAPVTTTVSAVIAQRAAQDGKPSITYRYAGDRGVLVEYGEMEFDLALNFFVLAVDDALRAQPAGRARSRPRPGFRSILVMLRPVGASRRRPRRPPPRRSTTRCEAERGIDDPEPASCTCRSRSTTRRRRATPSTRYIHSIRKDAPNAEGGTNIDYVVRYNGLRGPGGAVRGRARAPSSGRRSSASSPGLPFMFPLDPRETRSSSPSTTRRGRGRPRARSASAARATRSTRSSRPAATS